MSAYLCNPTHIAVLAARLFPSDPDKAVRAAKILANENVKSVVARYPDCDTPDKACQSFLDMSYLEYSIRCTNPISRGVVQAQALALPVSRVLGMIHCLNYQSCEHKDWETSAAKRLLDKLIAQLGATWQTPNDGW